MDGPGCSKRKEKQMDLSKLTPMEALLIGESQALSSQLLVDCSSSKPVKDGKDKSYFDTDEDVGEMEDDDDEENEDGDPDESREESGSESESDDFELVSDLHVEKALQKYHERNGESSGSGDQTQASSQLSTIPEGGLEIVIPREGVFRKTKKELTEADIRRRLSNRILILIQEYLHKTSVLCQLWRGLQFNAAINSALLHDAIKEQLKGQSFSGRKLGLPKLERFIKWFRYNVIVPKPSITDNLETNSKGLTDEECLAYQIMEKTALDRNWTVLIFAAFLRYLEVDVRLVTNIIPIPLKPPTGALQRKPRDEEEGADEPKAGGSKKSWKKGSGAHEQGKLKSSGKKKIPRGRKSRKAAAAKNSQGSQGSNTGRRMISDSEDEVDEDDTGKKRKKGTHKEKKKSDSYQTLQGQDLWTEVFLVEEDHWISVDILSGGVCCETQLEREATQPITYVLAFDGKNKIKDVTRRYASDWLMGTQKLRAKSDWWDKTLRPYKGKRNARDKEEDEFLDEHVGSRPIPKSMSEIKGHPLYVMRQHLLKFEGLYPENPPSVGFIKGEPIYSRDNVYTLHTRELWFREAKVVRIGEEPYKIVKARPKYDKLTGARLPDGNSELFGPWQTEDYIPPIAQDGKVPRNEYGNVELFTEKLMPQGCVHLRLAGLQRVAKKLDIDCAPAVVGFDFGRAGSRPTFDGFVVCKEVEEILVDAWNEEQEERKKKDEEKRLQRIYGNWRKLVRGVMIRSRLEKKYSIDLSGKRKSEDGPSPSTSASWVSKRARRK